MSCFKISKFQRNHSEYRKLNVWVFDYHSCQKPFNDEISCSLLSNKHIRALFPTLVSSLFLLFVTNEWWYSQTSERERERGLLNGFRFVSLFWPSGAERWRLTVYAERLAWCSLVLRPLDPRRRARRMLVVMPTALAAWPWPRGRSGWWRRWFWDTSEGPIAENHKNRKNIKASY